MAKKKPRTPPPPRPVQAPRAGTTSTKGPRDPRKTRLMFLGLIGAIVLIAVAAVLAIALGGGDEAGAEVTAGGCTTETFPEQGREHVEALPAGYEYNSFPPTSGSHNAVPAIYNVYGDPVDQMLLVHNLEHGAIVVQYGDQVPQSEIDSIVAWYSDGPERHHRGAAARARGQDRGDCLDPAHDVPGLLRGGLRRVHRVLPLPGPRALQPRRDAARHQLSRSA